MKVKLIFLVLSFYATILNTYAEHRYKVRGPPLPPRPPKPPMYIKKWPITPGRLPPVRAYHQRPPVSLNSLYKGHRIMHHRPQIPAITPLILPPTVWKVPNLASFKTPIVAKPTLVHFPTSPNVIPEYEYHISKPVEPLDPTIQPHTPHTIKQIDEKGPIHTIPAPNLSLSDKPIVVSEVQSIQQNIPQITAVPVKTYQLNQHQYQVTEHSNDQTLIDPLTGKPKYYAPDPDPSLPAPKLPAVTDPYSTPSNSKQHLMDTYAVTDQPLLGVHEQMASQDFLQFLQSYPQQQILDTYGLSSLTQQPQLQHLIQQPQQVYAVNPSEPNYNSASQQPIIQETQNYIRHDFQPQYQTFNYDEQTKQNSVPGSLFGQANYNLEAATSNQPSIRNTQEYSPTLSLTQPFMQPYIQSNIDSGLTSNVVDSNFNQNVNLANVPDPSIIYSQLNNHPVNNNEHLIHYTTLPSREVAEKLASLQAAGQMLSQKHNSATTSNDQQHSASEKKEYTPLRIVVPDEDDKNNLNSDDVESSASNRNEIIENYDISKNDRKDTDIDDSTISDNNDDLLKERFYDYEEEYGHENDADMNEEMFDNLTENGTHERKQSYSSQLQQANKT